MYTVFPQAADNIIFVTIFFLLQHLITRGPLNTALCAFWGFV